MTETKPKLELSELDENVFSILGRARRAARRAGWSDKQIADFMDEAAAGDYDHAIHTCIKHFEVE